ncbi:hypothetical protein L227DRAFT_577848 [Lentinus tigrinus ALCF2SS1-6]|uniref:BTB domain-containing protein n=1 Tax=Lentinus tigrinus ALCF2SS1-6 TaxID=1328759 RepID=A0A5C2S881_9APHY|nr:hypothetical protein L227DRAFT_577848 [Lentinus tigrinus ALCF2SS1-6]
MSSATPTSTTPTVARSPFNDTDADIIIRSADGVDFHLYKVVLAKASPVFRGMLTLPDAQGQGEPQVVDITEDADTLEGLLRFCYPVSRPVFQSVDKLGPVLAAAKKYDMPSVLEDLVRSFESLLPTAPPLRTYTLACLLELPDIARQAAKLLLGDPHCFDAEPMPPEFRVLPCEVMYVFAVYRGQCLKAALSVVDDWDWLLTGNHNHQMQYSNKGNPHLHSTWIWLACVDCGEDDTREVWAGKRSGGATLYPRKWWARYVKGVREALTERPMPRVTGEAALRERALSEAASCETCAPKAPLELAEFSHSLLKRIEQAVNKVSGSSVPYARLPDVLTHPV